MLQRGDQAPAVAETEAEGGGAARAGIAAEIQAVLGNGEAGLAIVDGGAEARLQEDRLRDVEGPGRAGIGVLRAVDVEAGAEMEARHEGVGEAVVQRGDARRQELAAEVQKTALAAARIGGAEADPRLPGWGGRFRGGSIAESAGAATVGLCQRGRRQDREDSEQRRDANHDGRLGLSARF